MHKRKERTGFAGTLLALCRDVCADICGHEMSVAKYMSTQFYPEYIDFL